MVARVFQITSICFVLAYLLTAQNCLLADSGSLENRPEISQLGITTTFLPDTAHPGDVVRLKVEMNRTTWGQFELQIPNHPGLHPIAVEKVPLTYTGGIYLQRQSLLFQPIASGPLTITGASVVISTPDGSQTVELTDMTLQVLPFENVELSETPLPLPLNEETLTGKSVVIWIASIAILLSLLALVVFAFCFRKKSSPDPDASIQPILKPNDVVHQLRSGGFKKHDLAALLKDPGFTVSENLRTAIERAVYSEDFRLEELATLLQKELPA